MLFKAAQELFERRGVNAAVLNVVGNDLSLLVDRSSDRYGAKADLLLWQENWPRLRSVPDFRRNLTTSENSFVHVEDVLPPVPGLHKALEAYHSTLPLPALLARGQVYLNSQDPLLYTHFFVELAEAINRDFGIFELFLEIDLPLN